MGSEGLVVVGVDGSDSARQATEWAADVGSAWGVPLRLVHAVSGAAVPPDLGWLRELCDAAERAGVGKVDSRVVPGTVVDELVASSYGAGLIVVGSYGEGARSGMLAGTAALGLIESAHCPVAVVRGASPELAPPRSGPVVVGTDASPDGDAALDVGAALALGLGARLVVVHAWSDIVQDERGVHRLTDSGVDLAAHAVERLDRCLRPLRADHPDLAVERHVVDDTALRALLELAAGARVVVVGHRRGSARTRMLGSTSRGLVGFAPCPVVVTAPSLE